MQSVARPRKPEGEKQKTVGMRWPPALWARVTRAVGERKRTRFIHDAVKEALDRDYPETAESEEKTAE